MALITFSQAVVKVTDTNPNATFKETTPGRFVFFDHTYSDEVLAPVYVWEVEEFGASGGCEEDLGNLRFHN